MIDTLKKYIHAKSQAVFRRQYPLQILWHYHSTFDSPILQHLFLSTLKVMRQKPSLLSSQARCRVHQLLLKQTTTVTPALIPISRSESENSHQAKLLGSRKSMKVVQPAGPEALNIRSSSTSRSGSRVPGSMPPPSIIPGINSSQMPRSQGYNNDTSSSKVERKNEFLFLPSSQMSAEGEELLRSTGLVIENMDEKELTDMLEGEGEEVDFSYVSHPPKNFKRMFTTTKCRLTVLRVLNFLINDILDETQSEDITRVSFLFNLYTQSDD